MQDNAVYFSKYYGMHDKCVIENYTFDVANFSKGAASAISRNIATLLKATVMLLVVLVFAWSMGPPLEPFCCRCWCRCRVAGWRGVTVT